MLVFNYKRTLCDILHHTAMGSKRRQEIAEWLSNPENADVRIFINRKYCRQMRLDTDLQKLVKSGFLVQKRMNRFGHSRVSFLEKA